MKDVENKSEKLGSSVEEESSHAHFYHPFLNAHSEACKNLVLPINLFTFIPSC